MDVEDSGIPIPRVPEDFGIEPDFDMLEEEDEVSIFMLRVLMSERRRSGWTGL
jgi:hypothetical protein